MTSLMAWEREEREESALPMAVCVHACEIECWMLRDNYALRGKGGEGGGKEEWERRRKEGRKNGRGGGRREGEGGEEEGGGERKKRGLYTRGIIIVVREA